MAEFTQARIRISEEGAFELLEALNGHEGFLLDVRDVVTNKDERKALNRRIADVRRIQDETERTINEQGWSRGQSQRSHP